MVTGVSANAASFPDVPSGQSNSAAIEYAQTNDIVSGYDDGTFRPDRTIDRAEFLKIVIRTQFNQDEIDRCVSENIPASSTYVYFPDVPKGAWYAGYLCVAKSHNILNGYPDGTFRATSDISFIESTKIILNAFGLPVSVDSIWYKPFVEKMATEKAIPVTIMGFNDRITRGEMVEMIYRLRANVTDKPSLTYETVLQMNTHCLGTSGGTPVIAAISTASGTVGTQLHVQGCNFSGFEGDKNLWIENSQGLKGILYGQSTSTSELIHVTLESSLCQTDNSYSGLPCDQRLALSPGKYWIYAAPWGRTSNRMEFTIVDGNQPAFQNVTVGVGETKNVPLTLTDGRGALKIDYGTGARVVVNFNSTGSQMLTVDLQTPYDAIGNIRVSQIIKPDGTSDGPFGKYMTYSLTKTGQYQVVLAPNMMAGDPWSGMIDMNLVLR